MSARNPNSKFGATQSRRAAVRTLTLGAGAALGALLLGSEAADAGCGSCSSVRCFRRHCYGASNSVLEAYACCSEATGICYGTFCWTTYGGSCYPAGTSYDYCV